MENTSDFELSVINATHTVNYDDVWNLFLSTEFFVRIIQRDIGGQTENFLFAIHKSQDGKPMVMASEKLSRLALKDAGEAIKVRGGHLISILDPQVGILIALSDAVFGLPANLVAWLRTSMQTV